MKRATRDHQLNEQSELAAFIANPGFPCLGAKAAFNSGSYKLASYERLAEDSCTAQLAVDLEGFQHSALRDESDYASFIAIFRAPQSSSETEFEKLLWLQLRQLHEIDSRRYSWDASVSSHVTDPHFSFSFAGKALYVIGMHANSSRLARRFRWPTLIFNPHEQFERLRQDGRWLHLRDVIRKRDVALQGSSNPMLADFGEASEARQYSGRVVAEDWHPEGNRCPFAH